MDASEPPATDGGSARRPRRALLVVACVLGLLLAASGVPALSPPVETNQTEGAIKDTVNGAAEELGLADYDGNLTVEDPSELEGLSGLARDITITGDVVIEDPGDLNGNVTAGNVTVEGDVIVKNPEEWTREDVENLPDGVTADDLRVQGDHQRSQLPTIHVDDTPFESTDEVPDEWTVDEPGEDGPIPSDGDDGIDTPDDILDDTDDEDSTDDPSDTGGTDDDSETDDTNDDSDTNDDGNDANDDSDTNDDTDDGDGSTEDDGTNDDGSTSDDGTNDGTDEDGTGDETNGDGTNDGTDDGTGGDGTGDGSTGNGDGTDQGGSSDDDSPIDVSLEDEPVPGQEITLTVTENGEPLANAQVTFNGEFVGTTGADGRVSGEVPYSTELRIGVQPSSASQTSDDEASGSGTRTASSDGDTATSTSGAAASESRQPTSTQESAATSAEASSDGSLASSDGSVLQQESNRTITMELPTDATVTVVGDRYQGSQVLVRATLDGRPLAEANVSVNGRELATTDAEGTATVRLPDADRANVTVRRGQVTGETQLDLQSVSVTVDAGPAALPTRSATVRVTANGSPVSDATVTVDGEAVATTDENGTATVTVPAEPGATIGVGEDGTLAATTVHPVRNLAIAGGAALASLLVGLLLARRLAHRRGVALRTVPTLAWRRTLGAPIERAGGPGAAAATAGASAGEVGKRVLATIWEGLRRGGRALWWLTALPRWALASVLGRSDPAVEADEQSGGADVAAPLAARSSDPSGAAGAIRTAWATLVAALPIDRPATRTPAEIAERAIEAGFPADAVETVLDAYRSVEYGAATPDPALAERVRAAVERATETEGDRG